MKNLSMMVLGSFLNLAAANNPIYGQTALPAMNSAPELLQPETRFYAAENLSKASEGLSRFNTLGYRSLLRAAGIAFARMADKTPAENVPAEMRSFAEDLLPKTHEVVFIDRIPFDQGVLLANEKIYISTDFFLSYPDLYFTSLSVVASQARIQQGDFSHTGKAVPVKSGLAQLGDLMFLVSTAYWETMSDSLAQSQQPLGSLGAMAVAALPAVGSAILALDSRRRIYSDYVSSGAQNIQLEYVQKVLQEQPLQEQSLSRFEKVKMRFADQVFALKRRWQRIINR